MNKYTKITSFDVGTERPTEEYVANTDYKNAALKQGLRHIIAWINQPEGLLTVKQLIDAVTLICNDTLLAAKEQE